jgi:hypothetical protein
VNFAAYGWRVSNEKNPLSGGCWTTLAGLTALHDPSNVAPSSLADEHEYFEFAMTMLLTACTKAWG